MENENKESIKLIEKLIEMMKSEVAEEGYIDLPNDAFNEWVDRIVNKLYNKEGVK